MRDLRELNLQPNGDRLLPPPTAEQVALVERAVGRTLPRSYLAFLDSCNGCHSTLRWFSFEVEGRSDGDLVAAFYAISTETADTDDTSEVAWNYFQRGSDVPDGIVPIAMTPFGDNIYLDLTELGAGRVLLERHERPTWVSGNLPTDTNPVIYVAPSFEAFLDLLTEMPDEE